MGHVRPCRDGRQRTVDVDEQGQPLKRAAQVCGRLPVSARNGAGIGRYRWVVDHRFNPTPRARYPSIRCYPLIFNEESGTIGLYINTVRVMAAKLTPRQQEILDLIRSEIQRTGFPPTRVEIAQALGFRSPNAAEDHLRALARKGAIVLTAGASRGIRLADAPAQAVPAPSALAGAAAESLSLLLPIVGRVAAGSPILAAEHIEREIGVEPSLFHPVPDYLLRVRGLSMRDAGILDGDLLAVRKTPEARNGQIVVARLGDEVTVKRLQRQGNLLQLLPENPDFAPITVRPGDEFAIEGVAVGLIRATPLH